MLLLQYEQAGRVPLFLRTKEGAAANGVRHRRSVGRPTGPVLRMLPFRTLYRAD
jgi:hypothetical protein